MIALLTVALLQGCTPVEPGVVQPWSEVCKARGDTFVAEDVVGRFLVEGPSDTPGPFGVGVWIDGTGGLNVWTCIESQPDDLLDRLDFDLTLTLFELDDLAIDLPVTDDAEAINVLWGHLVDWDDVVDWDQDSDFLYLADGEASFSAVDKQGRLVGVISVTETDPPGTPMTITVDLAW